MNEKSPVRGKEASWPHGSYNSSEKLNSAGVQEDGFEIYKPWEHRDLSHPLGTLGALFHMVKGSLGAGILSMPVAFKNGGLWASLGCAIFVGIIYTHCINILVHSCQVLCTRLKQPRLGFAEIAEAAFSTGPSKWRPYTAFSKGFVDVGLFMGYYCCCVVYIVFTATSIKQMSDENFGSNVDIRLYVLLVTLIVSPMGLMPHLKYLVPFSFLAICALTFSCIYVLWDIVQDLPPLISRPAFTSFEQLPLFLATMMFAIDNIGTVFPVENAMSHPQHFLGCPGVFSVSMVWLIFFYCTMGFFGYWRYGDNTQGSITLNISSSIMGQAVKGLVTLNVVCSYGLFFYVPSEILWRKLKPSLENSHTTFRYYSMRSILIIGTGILAAIVPDLEHFLGLVGAVCSSTLVLFFPPIIELVTFWEDEVYMGRLRWRLYKNLLILLIWLVVLVSGTQASVSKLLELYSS